jgi:hypothetical protein
MGKLTPRIGVSAREAARASACDTRIEAIEQDWRALGAAWRVARGLPRGPDFVYADEGFHCALAVPSGEGGAGWGMTQPRPPISATSLPRGLADGTSNDASPGSFLIPAIVMPASTGGCLV